LREAVVRRVDGAPLDAIARVREAAQHDAEVAAALRRRRAEEPIYVLQEDVVGPLGLEDAIDLPPQDALLAVDALRLRGGDAVVLTVVDDRAVRDVRLVLLDRDVVHRSDARGLVRAEELPA